MSYYSNSNLDSYYDSCILVYIYNNRYYISGSLLLESGIPEYKNSNKEKYYPISKYDIGIVKSALEVRRGFLILAQSAMPDRIKNLIVDDNKSKLDEMFPTYDDLSEQQKKAFDHMYESVTGSRRR